jgi:drug/metabolite transporter (DMT)-like permease
VSLSISQPTRGVALVESLLVSLIWASSFLFVKEALADLGPLTIAGLRYFGAFLILLPFMRKHWQILPTFNRRTWLKLLSLGFTSYVIGNGALFWGLKFIPAITASFMMSFTPVLVLLGGVFWLKEIPTYRQLGGIVISLLGGGLFFSEGLRSGEPTGVVILFIGLIGFALFSLLGRSSARAGQVNTLLLTALPLGMGGGILLLIGLPLEGLPSFSVKTLIIVIWLAAINTAFGYLLYNHALRVLPALEMNIMLNLSPLWTALMAWLVFHDRLSIFQLLGMLTVILGVVIVQTTQNNRSSMDSSRAGI